jgi:two-component system, cell cycle sensor histidine kinase and response regulator CckA
VSVGQTRCSDRSTEATQKCEPEDREPRDRSLAAEIELRQRVEASLRVCALEWQETFNAARDAICVLDADWRIRRCNEAMTKLVKTPLESLLGQNCCEIVHRKCNVRRRCLKARLRKSLHRETTFVREDNRWFAVTADPLLDEAGNLTGAIHVISDITKRRRAEKAKKTAEDELAVHRLLAARADRLRSLGEMAAGIAHELNQPLVGVRGLAEHCLIAMQKGWNITQEKLREKLALIVDQADRMSHIIEHVRTFAREADKPEMRSVRINDMVRGAVSMLGTQLKAQGIVLECELADNLTLISANPFSLEEVVLNLITNARDAVLEKMKAGVPIPHPFVVLRTFEESQNDTHRVIIQLVDKGVGIPDELIGRVFEPFFTTKGPDRGTGLGLPVCKRIVEQFGGTMSIHSEAGRGTTVTVAFPAQEVSRG